MIDFQIYIFGGVAVLLVLVLSWALTVWEMRPKKSRPTFKSNNVRIAAVRSLYGAQITELVGSDHTFEDSFEVCEAGEFSYTRVMIDFPERLIVTISLMKEAKGEIYKRFLATREVEIGDPEFDAMFLIFAHSQDEFEAHVDPQMRALLMELAGRVSELKLAPDGMFLQCYEVLDEDTLELVLDLAHTIAKTYYANARALEEAKAAEQATDDLIIYDEGHFGLHARDL